MAEAFRQVREHTDRLDLLVNVAATPETEPVGPGLLGEPGSVYDANVFGPVRVTEAFLPLLRSAPHPRVVMLTATDGPPRGRRGFDYTRSAAALRVVTAVYAETLPEVGFGFVDPEQLADHPLFAEPAVLTPAGRGRER